ncbi:exopolysaccharide biosynthesis polyprenyl glycosylphosphotransferase [Cellulophaga baltica]|uniref:exopolysaccharide biosynthesis polyprenyl glycosylphosphotransferase n=1 Tax=Cellulophaga TaxID=104264 RepID=UPI001C06E11A|nr:MULTISPECIES: exopolysaccharide biosynthesis polyprenyl glycosylphosphotransferase [Cellulophaga]MBU2995968.1 exopolysaccharide biosynthesis polyprenyl glycosylphosphotransferase [Cellulophaga baltica]MDO6767363.1 exopolysaccharide biosynthesis polyprenyl glycosylphosphotransferase [Cellulophaga sp. 1_MG-2023]
MFNKQNNFISFLTPIIYLVDILIINFFAKLVITNFQKPFLFNIYITICWILISIITKFYSIYRFSKITYILKNFIKQFSLFFLILFAFLGFFKQLNISRLFFLKYYLIVTIIIFLLKFGKYILLLKFRKIFKDYKSKVVVIGKNKKTSQLINVFNIRPEYGYNFVKGFDTKEKGFNLKNVYNYILNNNVNEIYCSVSELKNSELNEIINFADNNIKLLKFIPDNKNIFSKKLKFEYYDYIPVLSLRDIPLHSSLNSVLKRFFDIIFSIFVIIGLLSWLTPIIALIIRLESKGPIFFRQLRNGIDNKEFYCYKFRSMGLDNGGDRFQTVKNDMRVTKVGKFIRRTSIDELPQFYNVLFGNMSVVGPRPHMLKLSLEYEAIVDKYMLRQFVKPGITGLAQVRGYRGEIEEDSDIINRVKFDIFYVENWSLILDLKIILQTIIKAINGDENAI